MNNYRVEEKALYLIRADKFRNEGVPMANVEQRITSPAEKIIEGTLEPLAVGSAFVGGVFGGGIKGGIKVFDQAGVIHSQLYRNLTFLFKGEEEHGW